MRIANKLTQAAIVIAFIQGLEERQVKRTRAVLKYVAQDFVESDNMEGPTLSRHVVPFVWCDNWIRILPIKLHRGHRWVENELAFFLLNQTRHAQVLLSGASATLVNTNIPCCGPWL